jgi:hypothetical protein
MKNLAPDRLRGSFLRCLLITGQTPHQTAELLTNLIEIPNVVISDRDYWMPQGIRNYKETKLINSIYFLPSDKRQELKNWWLKKPRGASLPNWDIASTCTIEGVRGLLLVEAKAHDKELSEAGKSDPTTCNSRLNHDQIAQAIAQANSGLNRVLEGWTLSHRSHYQLSNRFAWAWKLATLGLPVILVYLGFLHAIEMLDQGQPFDNPKAWQICIRNHAEDIVPEDAWEKRLEIDRTPVWFLIRSTQLKLEVMR